MKYRITSRRVRGDRLAALSRGFTLGELLVTISIATILVTLSVPSFSDFVKNNRMITQTNDFVTALNVARSEAIRRGNRITLYKSSDGAGCVSGEKKKQNKNNNNKTNNNNTNNNKTTDVLRVHGALPSGVT